MDTSIDTTPTELVTTEDAPTDFAAIAVIAVVATATVALGVAVYFGVKRVKEIAIERIVEKHQADLAVKNEKKEDKK